MSAGTPDEPIGITYERACERAGRVANTSASLTLRLTDDANARRAAKIDLHFDLTDASQPLVLDFAPDHTELPELSVGGVRWTATVLNGHIVIPARLLTHGRNTVSISFTAGSGGLHRSSDLVYSLFVPARASHVFPCFDQPDLRTRWTVTVEIPHEWEAVSNARQTARTRAGTVDRVTFAETAPLPSYLLAIAAGRLVIDEATIDGRALRIFHREADAAGMARNRAVIIDRHERALAWLEAWTACAYPFDSFDIVLLPSFQFGGMEHPGAIYYRSDLLVLDEAATPTERLARDHVIAHETAHLWFGDLVTMRWFDDVWLKEVLANVMAAKILTAWHPDEPHDLRFLIQHYPSAYTVDRSEGAAPIRQPLANLDDAGSLYGPTIYLKAPIAFRDLERLIGADPFRRALRLFLHRHRLGNADWIDLLCCLQLQTSRDLAAWSREWIETAGRPTFHLDDDRVTPYPWDQLPGGGLGYGDVVLSQELQDALLQAAPGIGDPVRRAAAWIVLWDAMQGRRLPPPRLFEVLRTALASESQPLTRQLLCDYARELFWRFTPAESRAAAAAGLESVLRVAMERAVSAGDKATWLSVLANVALTGPTVDWLYEVWSGTAAIAGLELSETVRMQLALALSIRRPSIGGDVLRAQASTLRDAEARARLEFLSPAVAIDFDVREAFAERLGDPAHRHRESWVLDAARLLHHPLREGESCRWVIPALARTRAIQRSGDIFFPRRWVEATLAGHQSPAVARDVREFIDALPPDYPPHLRRILLAGADPLFRAARWLTT